MSLLSSLRTAKLDVQYAIQIRIDRLRKGGADDRGGGLGGDSPLQSRLLILKNKIKSPRIENLVRGSGPTEVSLGMQ